MTAAFDSELRQQEHELNLKMDEMRALVLSHDLKVRGVNGWCPSVNRMCFHSSMLSIITRFVFHAGFSWNHDGFPFLSHLIIIIICCCICVFVYVLVQVKLLSKEAESHSLIQLHTTEVLKASKQFCEHIQNQLQHKEQEIKDLTAVKDYRYAPVLCMCVCMCICVYMCFILCLRIKELEDELKWMETKLKNEEDNHIKKWVIQTNLSVRQSVPAAGFLLVFLWVFLVFLPSLLSIDCADLRMYNWWDE